MDRTKRVIKWSVQFGELGRKRSEGDIGLDGGIGGHSRTGIGIGRHSGVESGKFKWKWGFESKWKGHQKWEWAKMGDKT